MGIQTITEQETKDKALDPPVFPVLGNLSRLTPGRRDQLEKQLLAIGVKLFDLRTELMASAVESSRRYRIPETFAEVIEWEREFGEHPAGWSWRQKPRLWVEHFKHEARRWGLSYVDVKAAYLKVWAGRDSATTAARNVLRDVKPTLAELSPRPDLARRKRPARA